MSHIGTYHRHTLNKFLLVLPFLINLKVASGYVRSAAEDDSSIVAYHEWKHNISRLEYPTRRNASGIQEGADGGGWPERRLRESKDRKWSDERESSRLFFGGFAGHRRRLKFALMPIMFKLGVISTLLVVIALMVVKGLTIGVIMLFFVLGNAFSKLKYHHGHQQPVHVHVHTNKLHSRPPVYTNYEPSEQWDRELDDHAEPGYDDPKSYRRPRPLYPVLPSGYTYYPYRGYYRR